MLKVVKKTYCGVVVGYVVGWWFYPRRNWGVRESGRQSFRSIRNGLVFATELEAKAWRDDIENKRANSVVVYSEV